MLHWREIAGPEVARIARPFRFSEKDGLLTLTAEPGAAMFLAHEGRALAGRINQWLGRAAVSRIKFVQTKLQQSPRPPAPPKPGKAPNPADPVHSYQGPENLKAALASLARWNSRNRGD